MNLLNLLHLVREDVLQQDYPKAQKDLDELLTLLKEKYLAGPDGRRYGFAFNHLLPLRKELQAGILSEESKKLLQLPSLEEAAAIPEEAEKPQKVAPAKAEQDFFSALDEKNDDKEKTPNQSPEDTALKKKEVASNLEFLFSWDDIPTVTFDDIAGLEECKDVVRRKVLLPLMHPELTEGYVNKGGGGVCLYGPPGTGKTMISAAIANQIHAKFCSITPSDFLRPGFGSTERAVKELFKEARSYPCSILYFDEMDSIAPKNTKSTAARQLRSEFLAQLQGMASYRQTDDHILFLICATNKPWDIDSAFLRPGRFGTKIYVGLPDETARRYIIDHRLEKVNGKHLVDVNSDIDVDQVVEKTNGYSCADMANLLDYVEELSMNRAASTGEKIISNSDFQEALEKIHSSVQADDIIHLKEWRMANNVAGSDDRE